MPINTTISGNPDSVHATATWLRGHLAATINNATVSVIRSREMSGTSWTGPAATAFGARIDHIRGGTDQLVGDIQHAAERLDRFAEALRTSQAEMNRVADTARSAGLHVEDKVIFEPLMVGCYADPAVQAAADARHQRMVTSYEVACVDARRVLLVFSAVEAAVAAVLREIAEKQVMLAMEFVGKTIERLGTARISELQTKAQAIEGNPVVAQWRGEPGIGSGKQLTAIQSEIGNLKADVFWAKVFDKMSTAGSIAYDIAHGKPPVKAVATNLAGSTGGGVIGKLIAKNLTAKGFGTAAVAVAGSGGGALAGVVIGLAAEAGWNALPQGLRDKIEKGAHDLFEAGKKALVTKWHELENSADKFWRMIF